MNKTRFLLSAEDIRELYFHPSASGCSPVCVLLSLSIIVSARCPLFPLASVTCLTLLLIIDTHTHTQTDRQTHTNLKNRLKVDTYTVNIMLKRKLMGCSSSRLVKELCRKGIMTLNLMRGQTNHTGVFFISHVTTISFAPTVKGL